MYKPFQPLLAATITSIHNLIFPLIASPKLDGIRCIVKDGKALSRKLKPIPNIFIREKLEEIFKDASCGFDGEIMINGVDFNGVQSAVMSFDGEPDFVYKIFDRIYDAPYWIREPREFDEFGKHVRPHLSMKIKSLEELIALEDEWVKEGYEGIMLRDPESRYKYGRSTEKEQILLKLKRFYDAEAEIIGFEEKLHNNNIQEKDALGYSKRSSSKAGMVHVNTLGSLVISAGSLTLRVGSGFTDEQRKEIWNNKDEYIGATITYKYQELSKYGIPRFPVFKAFRRD